MLEVFPLLNDLSGTVYRRFPHVCEQVRAAIQSLPRLVGRNMTGDGANALPRTIALCPAAECLSRYRAVAASTIGTVRIWRRRQAELLDYSAHAGIFHRHYAGLCAD